jgi:hypothetical protein
MSAQEYPITLYRDDSLESTLVQQELERSGAAFRTIYTARPTTDLPAVKTDLSSLYGYEDIRRYLLPDLTPDPDPGQYTRNGKR